MAKSPAHYRYYLEHGTEETAAMRLGTAVHRLVLGGPPVHCFDGERRGKKWEEFRDNLPGQLILNAREYDCARAIASAVKREAGELLDGCVCEAAIDWEFFGRPCRSTLDAFKSDAIIELKVSMTADPRYFWLHMAKQHWDAQLSFYERALMHATGDDGKRDLYIIAAEPKPPYPVTMFRLPEEARQLGRKKLHAWMEQLLACEKNDYWPAYADRVTDLQAPEWVSDELDEEDEEAA